ncbi:MAG: sulfatase [Candidatus Eisenbacteria sp.]|nr:sulfatase [Candidatus Eisenbacteria bacterium]
MTARSIRRRLLAVLFSGLALGALGLLEPLTRFWDYFHILGLSWPHLLLLYLGGGLAIAIVAGILVSLGYAGRAGHWLPISIAARYATATACLAGALALTPLIRRELASFLLPAPSGLILAFLLLIGALITIKVTPRLICPVVRSLIGMRSGQIVPLRLALVLIVIGSLIPITILKEQASRFHQNGRPPRTGLATRPSDHPVQNILLITIDALRADHLGLHGYSRATSPTLDAFGRGAIVFDRCFAQGNSTELSFGSLFTSLYPSTHSVRRHRNRASPLVPEIETLAENLRDAGLQTVGMMSNPFIKREWGLAQGFDRIDEFHYGYLDLLPIRAFKKLPNYRRPDRIPLTDVPRAGVVIDQAIDQLGELQTEPFFLLVHLMDVHHPYIPPQPYQTMFNSPGASQAAPNHLWKRSWPIFKMLPSEEQILPQADLRRVVDLYDGAIRYVDHEIGRLLTEVDRLGLEENTLVIITSDHGDEFLDHGDIFHKSPFLYDELTHVPLMIRYPGIAGGRREGTIVRHIDILPTLLALFQLPTLEAACGQNILPLLGLPGEHAPVSAYSQSYTFISVRTATHKLMADLVNDASYCFDLIADPGENNNQYGQEAACDSLEGALLEFLKKTSVSPAGQTQHDLDPRTRETLRSLGYIDM